MSKKQISLIALFVPFLVLISYFLYVTIISGKHYKSINLLENHKVQVGNFVFSSKSQQSQSEIEPIMLMPEGNPYRFNLRVGFSPKVGRASLKRTKYTHDFSLKDSKGNIILQNNKSHQSKNKLGGNAKLVLDTQAIGVVKVPAQDLYDLDLNITPGDTDIHSIELHIRKNVAEFNPLVLVFLIAAIIPGFLMVIKSFPKKNKRVEQQ